jgi:cytochrome c biogenesis protein CcmG/thiol:disulfide interchange protein DsbE
MRELDSINKRFAGWKSNYKTDFISVCVSNSKDVAAVNAKAKSHKWAFGMVLDGRNEAVNMLRIAHIPYTMVVDKDGYILYQHEGYSDDNLSNVEQIIKAGDNGVLVTK